MLHRKTDASTLRFVDASCVQIADVDLSRADFRGADDRKIGSIDGVVIDPAARRLCFLVVKSRGWLTSRRFLLPAEWPAQIDAGRNALRVALDSDELAQFEEFDRSAAPPHTDDDLIASMFPHRVA